jgi:hypothetical protein
MEYVAHNICCQIQVDDNVHLQRKGQSHAPVHILMRLYRFDKSIVCSQILLKVWKIKPENKSLAKLESGTWCHYIVDLCGLPSLVNKK